MQIFRDFQALHAVPEQDRQLPKTLAYLKEALGSRAFSPMDGALAAFFDFGAEKAIAFRTDMDALPGGHLCGHDGHMAILLELARRLEKKSRLCRNILLLFQPAEETTGGAADLWATGVLEAYRVEAIFGLHIWPGLPAGALFTRPGPVMAGACQVDVQIVGEAGHIASPGPNAVAAAAEFIRRSHWDIPEGLCKFGLCRGGSAGNVRAGEVILQGSLRCFSEETMGQRRAFLGQTAAEIQKESGCKVLCKLSEGYAPVDNPPGLVAQARQAVEFGEFPGKSWLSEDFSAYQQHIPGLFFFLGAGDGPQLHSPNFQFPLEILPEGAAFWQRLAEGFS